MGATILNSIHRHEGRAGSVTQQEQDVLTILAGFLVTVSHTRHRVFRSVEVAKTSLVFEQVLGLRLGAERACETVPLPI